MGQFQLLDRGKEELKSVRIMSMEQCAMTSGTDLMVMWFVDSSTSQLVHCKTMQNEVSCDIFFL